MQWFDRRLPLGAHASRAALLLVLLAGLVPAPAGAQVPVETSGGTRALGMGGAFSAVADDATAAWWNPAGLSSLLADGVIGRCVVFERTGLIGDVRKAIVSALASRNDEPKISRALGWKNRQNDFRRPTRFSHRRDWLS